MVANEFASPKCARRLGDTHAPQPEHVREEFVGQRKFIATDALPGHHQPSGQARASWMEAVAGSRL